MTLLPPLRSLRGLAPGVLKLHDPFDRPTDPQDLAGGGMLSTEDATAVTDGSVAKSSDGPSPRKRLIPEQGSQYIQIHPNTRAH
jgi:hypothetical protein